MPYYTEEQCSQLHLCFLKDISREIVLTDADVFVFYTGGESRLLRTVFGDDARYFEQSGDDLGERMLNAIANVKTIGYDKVVLIGSDIPELRSSSIKRAFAELDRSDVVIGPTIDGGYHLIGMKDVCESAFRLEKYGDSTVLDSTANSIKESGFSVAIADYYNDIDYPDDIQGYIDRARYDDRLSHSATYDFIMNNRKISIIIPTYNEESIILALLSQLEQYKNDAEIIIVDGSSSDKTVELIGDGWKVINCDKGRGRQMNLGATMSSGDILFFLHVDSKLPTDALGQIIRCMRTNRYGCFGIKFASRNFFMWTNKVISNHRAWSRGLPFGDQGIFIERSLFREVGGFPELPIMEDYEFARRMRALGYKPGRTDNLILSSDRRYRRGTIGILKTEFEIWNMRRKYRKGIDINLIENEYSDAR